MAPGEPIQAKIEAFGEFDEAGGLIGWACR
jgi:hypothetical protein